MIPFPPLSIENPESSDNRELLCLPLGSVHDAQDGKDEEKQVEDAENPSEPGNHGKDSADNAADAEDEALIGVETGKLTVFSHNERDDKEYAQIGNDSHSAIVSDVFGIKVGCSVGLIHNPIEVASRRISAFA